MEKKALLDELRERLGHELDNARRLASETAAAANHPEARPENDKDTRKIELSYLAAGQAARAQELESQLALLAAFPLRDFQPTEPLEPGAIVELEVAGKELRVFLLPAGGGQKLSMAGAEVSIVTPQSPLGGELLGKRVGDAFELRIAGQLKEVEVLAVS